MAQEINIKHGEEGSEVTDSNLSGHASSVEAAAPRLHAAVLPRHFTAAYVNQRNHVYRNCCNVGGFAIRLR